MQLPASRGLRGRIPQPRKFGNGDTGVSVRSPSEINLAGLAATRIVWITAIGVCALSILSGLLSGTDGRNFSQQLPGFAFTDGGNSSQPFPDFADFASLDLGAAPVSGDAHGKAPNTEATGAAGPQADRGQRVSEQVTGDSHSRAGAPQPQGPGGKNPSSTSGPNRPQAPPVSSPKPPQAPTVTVNVPKPPQAPSVGVSVPEQPQAPSGTSDPSPTQVLPQVSVNVSSPVQTPIVNVPDVSVQLP
jgi:hypothetical protein